LPLSAVAVQFGGSHGDRGQEIRIEGHFILFYQFCQLHPLGETTVHFHEGAVFLFRRATARIYPEKGMEANRGRGKCQQ
jgi:hypothetical protein